MILFHVSVPKPAGYKSRRISLLGMSINIQEVMQLQSCWDRKSQMRFLKVAAQYRSQINPTQVLFEHGVIYQTKTVQKWQMFEHSISERVKFGQLQTQTLFLVITLNCLIFNCFKHLFIQLVSKHTIQINICTLKEIVIETDRPLQLYSV